VALLVTSTKVLAFQYKNKKTNTDSAVTHAAEQVKQAAAAMRWANPTWISGLFGR
jgi:hypothetical protein